MNILRVCFYAKGIRFCLYLIDVGFEDGGITYLMLLICSEWGQILKIHQFAWQLNYYSLWLHAK